MNKKTCCHCKGKKPLTDFHRDRKSKGGRARKCAACQHEYFKEYYKNNKEKVAATRKRCAKNLNYKKTPEQNAAHWLIGNWIKQGKIIRPESCSECGKVCTVDAHHRDYSKPEEVTWLCRACHKKEHSTTTDSK